MARPDETAPSMFHEMHTLISSHPDGVLFIASDGKIHSSSHRAQAILGYSEEELQQTLWETIIAHQHTLQASIQSELERRGIYRGELCLIRKGGNCFPAEVSLLTFNSSRTPFVCAVIRDISGCKRVELETQVCGKEIDGLQNFQLAYQTAAVIAHEISQPLAAIASYAEASLLLLAMEDPDIDKVRKAVQESEKQALRAGWRMHELLASLSMTSDGQFRNAPVPPPAQPAI